MRTLFTLLLCTTGLWAQDFVIENVTLFDGETVHEKISVLVKDGTIQQVGNSIERGDEVIDGTGKFLMPAMTNSHVHAFMQPNLTEAAKAGVLNLLDMHGMETFQGLMQSAGNSDGNARYFYAGAAATAPNGHGTQYGFETPTLTSKEDAAPFVEARLNAGASYIKIIVEPWKTTLSHDIVKEIINEAHEKETIAVVHISKLNDAYTVQQNGANGLVHIWWDKKIEEEQLTAFSADESFFVIPTLLTSHLALDNIRKTAPDARFLTNEEISMEAKRLFDAGVPLLAGTDPPNANINYGTDLYKELVIMSEVGIPNLDVLKTATSNPAMHFRLEKKGYVKEGYTADLILLNANPVDDIQHIKEIETIWKEGKRINIE